MNRKIKTAVAMLTLSAMAFGMGTAAGAYTGWADQYVNFCRVRGIITGDEHGDLMEDSNLTREQMAKMILTALSVNMNHVGSAEYEDVSPDRWSYRYISKYAEYVTEQEKYFKPTETVTREEFLDMCMRVAGFANVKAAHADEFNSRFSDWSEIDEKYYNMIVVGYEKNFITGSDKKINPKSYLTRAEACTVLYKLIYAVQIAQLDNYYASSGYDAKEQQSKQPEQNTAQQNHQPAQQMSSTPLIGESVATLEQAKKWAQNRGAHQRYIDIADLYWKYGELTGIRADVLYAQAAKETNFGKYTGQVKPEQNNWAGIKKYGATGDLPEDHEDFATPEDGVRGHFNHMCAYVGLNPVGEPHGRYRSVKSLSWAGTVKTVEQLGGKWCPDANYGVSIINNYLNPMINTK